jgi:hypothetical protein
VTFRGGRGGWKGGGGGRVGLSWSWTTSDISRACPARPHLDLRHIFGELLKLSRHQAVNGTIRLCLDRSGRRCVANDGRLAEIETTLLSAQDNFLVIRAPCRNWAGGCWGEQTTKGWTILPQPTYSALIPILKSQREIQLAPR